MGEHGLPFPAVIDDDEVTSGKIGRVASTIPFRDVNVEQELHSPELEKRRFSSG